VKLEFTIISKESDGAFHAFIPEVPGVVSCGATLDQARVYVLDALSEMMAFRREDARAGSEAALTEKIILSGSSVSETAA